MRYDLESQKCRFVNPSQQPLIQNRGSLGKSARGIGKVVSSGKYAQTASSVSSKIVENLGHMKVDDIMGAVKDIFGNPVITNGKVRNHLQEVDNAISGLRTQAGKLERMIRSGKLTDEQVAAAKELIGLSNAHADRVQDTLDIARGVAEKAEKAAEATKDIFR